jgi:hypothetical protein
MQTESGAGERATGKWTPFTGPRLNCSVGWVAARETYTKGLARPLKRIPGLGSV